MSDGTLRYLLWVAALLSARPAELTVLNEPESSLHPDLLPALAALIARACEGSQIVVVTHSAPLVTALHECLGDDATVLKLAKRTARRWSTVRASWTDRPGTGRAWLTPNYSDQP